MSRLRRLVDDRWSADGARQPVVGARGELHVPWQVYTVDGPQLTVHYFTNATNELVDVRCAESAGEVVVTVVERQVSSKLPGQHRAQTVTLSADLAERPVVDGATGRPRDAFVLDPDTGWAAFDVTAAEWLLAGEALTSLELAACAALADGCRSTALERVAGGDRDLAAVYRERGLPVPDRRAAAKVAVDAALVRALDEDAHAEPIGFTLAALAESGRMDRDQLDQLGGVLGRYRGIQRALETTGDAEDEAARLLAAARELHAAGGLRPRAGRARRAPLGTLRREKDS